LISQFTPLSHDKVVFYPGIVSSLNVFEDHVKDEMSESDRNFPFNLAGIHFYGG